MAVAALVASASLLGHAPGTEAAVGHAFLSSLTEAPSGVRLGEPAAIAVDHSNGTLFVADRGVGGVDVFSSTGTFETQFAEGAEPAGIAVDEATGEVYLAEPFEDVVRVFKPDGKGGFAQLSEWLGATSPNGAFGEPAGVAIDNSSNPSDPRAGDLYVADGANNAVYVLKPPGPGPEEANEGTLVGSLTSGGLEAPNGIAVDSPTGRVLVADTGRGFVDLYGAGGKFEKRLTGAGSPVGTFLGAGDEEEGNVTAVGVDETTGEIYVAESERRLVAQFDSEGKWLGWTTETPAGRLAEPRGVAVAANGDLYVADAGAGDVDLFGPDVTVPDAKTSPASKVSKTAAVLNGTIDGDGKDAKYSFQWGDTESLGNETAIQSTGGTEEKVLAEVKGLQAGQTYFFRLRVANESGVNYGTTRQLSTKPAVEELTTGPVVALQPTEATLTGTLDPAGVDTHYFFQWGSTDAYGNKSPELPSDAGPGKAAVEAKAAVTGLAPNSLYHYRLVGEDEFGTTYGEDAVFTTSGPPVVSAEPATVEGHEAATLHGRIDPGELETTYRFEYGKTSAYGQELPVGGAKIPAGLAPVPESAGLTGLQIGATYHFRVVATNAAGTTFGPDRTFTTVPPALLEGLHATQVTASDATLEVAINPLGHDTSYQFQYGTQPCAPNPAACIGVPAPPGDVGAGEAAVAESQHIEDLSPHTTYYYRVIATNALGSNESAEHAVTTQEVTGPFALADDRAWEMVTPAEKRGAPVQPLTYEGGWIGAAENGQSFAYVADGSVDQQPEGNRAPEPQQILATRTDAGWSSRDIATPNSAPLGVNIGNAPEYQDFTPDLSTALVQPWGGTPDPPLAPGVKQQTMYLRNNASETYLPLVTEENAPGVSFGGQLAFQAATPDLGHVIIRSGASLTGPSSAPGLYEWTPESLQLVSVLPDGAPAAQVELGYYNDSAGALSDDGARVIWTTKEEQHRGHLYLRDTVHEETIRVDTAQGVAEPAGFGSAEFQGASSDGSRIFFTDKQRLIPGATAEPGQGLGKPDLYECVLGHEAATGKLTCELRDLTIDHNSGEHANVQGLVLGVSADGSTVYVVAQGVLATNENGNAETAQAGKDNLYVLSEVDGAWTPRFIGGLSSEDSPEWEGGEKADTAFVTARVTPSGNYLAFMSAASLTGYDNVDASPEADGAHDEEVFLYNRTTSALTCASCNPTGARPTGVKDQTKGGEIGVPLVVDEREVWVGHWLAGNVPGWEPESLVNAIVQPRYLSEGGRLFFNSPSDLVPNATNGREDVYEYEPSGVGSCESATGGCVSLISGGESEAESAFLDATPTGNDVFFITAASLLPEDTDTAYDIYDARVCTAESPCLTRAAPAPPGCSSADSCRPAQPSQPAPLSPGGTTTVSGTGNLTAGPAPAAGKVLGAKSAKGSVPTRPTALAKALAACKRRYSRARRKRALCEASARRRYRPHAKAQDPPKPRKGKR